MKLIEFNSFNYQYIENNWIIDKSINFQVTALWRRWVIWCSFVSFHFINQSARVGFISCDELITAAARVRCIISSVFVCMCYVAGRRLLHLQRRILSIYRRRFVPIPFVSCWLVVCFRPPCLLTVVADCRFFFSKWKWAGNWVVFETWPFYRFFDRLPRIRRQF